MASTRESLADIAKVHLFPVRHHSPRTSHVLRAFLEQVRPKAVLIEGPSDADGLIDVMLDGDTVPPIAILGYRTDGTPGSSLWPFASYSPEYVALRWAADNKATAKFIDITIGQALAASRAPVDMGDPGALEEEDEDFDPDAPPEESDEEPQQAAADGGEVEAAKPEPTLYQQIAESRGFRSFEEFWEASFEAPRYEEKPFREALLAYAELVRSEGGADRSFHRARDAYMAARIQEVIASGVKPEEIAVVVGAAHAAAFVAKDVDPALEAQVTASVPTAATVIPYSFPRLAEQTGYGAGNRAPQYYQRAHDNDCDFRRATLEVLVDFCDHLRMRGFTASLADTIESYRLACTLAEIRGKAGPGLDEVREATIATMCRGDAQHVDGFLWQSVVGRNVGKVAARIGKNSLQEEFWREIDDKKLPRTDSAEEFMLKLNDPVQVETSVFLHRLRVANIPYANFQGTQSPGMRNLSSQAQPEEAGGFAALARVKEAWAAQWTPSTDVALVERIVLGDSLQSVCERVLDERLAAAGSAGEAAKTLSEAVVTSAAQVIGEALSATDRLASADTDLASLADATMILAGLASYGTNRKGVALGDDAIVPLAQKTYERAIFRVVDGCMGTDEAIAPAKHALRILNELGLGRNYLDRASWISVARELSDSYVVNPACAGMAAGLLYIASVFTDDDITRIVSQRLSNVLEPEKAATFLTGFFEVNALALVKSKPVVHALDAFLVAIEKDRFRDALPMLRRAFGPLGATERRYLLENLLSIRKLGDKAKAATAVIAEKDKEKLKEIAKDLGDLDDLL